MKKLASFEIGYLQYLDESSKPANDLPEFAKDTEVLIDLFRDMQKLRVLDKRAVSLQRVGQLGTYPSSLGQEAIGVGTGSSMTENDVLVPYYRGHGTMLRRGLAPHELLLYWGGDERGSDFKSPACRQDFPIAVPIATQCLHAAGVAAAIKLRGESGRAVVTEIGEGGTSEGEFYESLNVAGAWQLPLVTVINNNNWAISVPPELQTACRNFAEKGLGVGIETLQVDGNDVIAVRDAVSKALDKARTGGGPTLIEAVCYRLCDHTTADDASRYVDKKALDKAWKIEPLGRLGKYLMSLGAVTEKQLQEWEEEAGEEAEKEVQLYLKIRNETPQPPEAMFDYLYENLPEKTRPQREEAIRRGAQ